MLRITPIKNDPNELILVVEGRMLGPWVAELEAAVARTRDSSPDDVFLDIAAVSFVDACGIALLHRLLRQGVRLRGASPFVLELLHMQ
jgi:anti-anti-sigma regulatory factor